MSALLLTVSLAIRTASEKTIGGNGGEHFWLRTSATEGRIFPGPSTFCTWWADSCSHKAPLPKRTAPYVNALQEYFFSCFSWAGANYRVKNMAHNIATAFPPRGHWFCWPKQAPKHRLPFKSHHISCNKVHHRLQALGQGLTALHFIKMPRLSAA